MGFLRALIIAVPFLVLDFLVVGICQAIGRGFTSLVFAVLRKVVFEIPATVALNAAFGVAALAYGAFAAEIVMSVTGMVTLLRIFKKFKGVPGRAAGGCAAGRGISAAYHKNIEIPRKTGFLGRDFHAN